MAALAELGPIVLLIIALGLAIIASKLIEALIGPLVNTLKAIPVIGDKLAAPFEATAAAVTRALGHAEAKIDQLIGAMFHILADQFSWLWREIKSHGVALLESATLIGAIVAAIHAIRGLIHKLTTGHAHSDARIKRLEKEYHGIERKIRQIRKELNGIDETGLQSQVTALDKEIGKIKTQTIPAIRAAEQADAGAIGNLWDWVKRNVAVPGTAVFTGAVAVALSALGLGWLRCDSNPFNNNKRACGLWGDLAGLLAAAGVFGAALDFRDIVKASVIMIDEGTQAIEALTVLDDAAIQDAAQAVAAAVRAVTS